MFGYNEQAVSQAQPLLRCQPMAQRLALGSAALEHMVTYWTSLNLPPE